MPPSAFATTLPGEPSSGERASRAGDGAAWPERVASRYALEESLGSGGMGEVFAARDTQTGDRVALKLVRRTGAAPRGVERLLREASAAGRVSHPGVVRVLEAGEDVANDLAFIAQELLVGETLRARLDRLGRMAPADACSLAAQIVDALAAAHAVGVVHRDLKPENIFLEGPLDAARPRVIDFGIARLVASDDLTRTQLTATGSVLGTPAYMSPEQARGADDVDEQTDVWAVGVVLYEMLTGATPFARATPHATLAAILLDPVPSPREAEPGVPEGLATVTLRCIARSRVERFGSMTELAEALRQAVPAVGPARASTSVPATRSRGRGAALAIAGAVVAATLAVGVRGAARSPSRTTPPPAAVMSLTPAAAARPTVSPDPLPPPATPVQAPHAIADGGPSQAHAPAPTRRPRPRAAPPIPAQPTERPDPRMDPSTTRRTNGAPIVGL